jgi:translation initiation factor 1
MTDGKSSLVYSTDRAIAPKEKHGKENYLSHANSSQRKVIVRLDRKGRGGKSVTVIEGLQISQEEIVVLLRQLKAKLGTGGTVKAGVLEIQGSHCDAVMSALNDMGYPAKRSGG